MSEQDDPQELRRKAARAREAAKIRTDGGTEINHQLEFLAEKLEQRARDLERWLTNKKTNKKPRP
jgi:hypothetical protein